eukprot:3858264-Ditylum_brightwellii.AAC.1
MPYSNHYQPVKDVPIGGVATAWTDPDTGHTIVIELHQVLMFCDELEMTLVNPNQVHHAGHYIQDDYARRDEGMAIKVQGTKIHIPLEMKGVIIGFETRRPTEDELENCARVSLTDDVPWEPQEMNILSHDVQTHEIRRMRSGIRIADINICTTSNEPQIVDYHQSSNALLASISPVYSDVTLLPRIVACVAIAH